MRNLSKKAGQIFFNIFLITLFLGSGATAFSAPGKQIIAQKPCTAMDVTVTGKSSGAISFAWGPVAGANTYNVRYVRKENGQSGLLSTSGTAINISGLSAGTYTFYFTVAGDPGNSEYVIIEDVWI
ncbi:MAG: fibronectin type III domain-containing protein [Bacteroidota bacterium]